MANWSSPMWVGRKPRLATITGVERAVQDRLGATMKGRTIWVALVVGALAVAAMTAGAASSAPTARTANNLTVWLQVDAQSGWPDAVAAANQQFKNDHPGWNVTVQYQSWPDHLQKFDATLAANTAPDVIEMGNTEMTKYMAAGRVRGPDVEEVVVRELEHVAQGPRGVGSVQRQDLRRAVLRGLARRDLPHRPVQEGRHQQAAVEPRASTRPTRGSSRRRTRARTSRRSTSPAPTGTSRWASSTTTAGGSRRRSAASGSARSNSQAAMAGLAAYKAFFQAASRRARRRSRRGRTRTTCTRRAARRR